MTTLVTTEKTLNPTQNQIIKYSPEEYLTLEEKAEFKHEYCNGEIIKIAGGTINHNRISGNIYAHLKFFLKQKELEVFMSDVKVWIPEYNIYTYPDVMIVAGEPIYQEKTTTTIINPFVIIEVLFISTQDYDRGKKFKYYRSIPQLKEYILIDQYQYGIEQFAKNQEEKWVLTEYKNPEETLKIESLSYEITLTDIYERVDFSQLEEKEKQLS